MRILVTGGAGYIGSMLTQELLSYGHKVLVLDDFRYGQTSLAHLIRNPNLDLFFGDVRDEVLMKKLLVKSDLVIPLAAIVGAPACDRDPLAAKSINRDSVISLIRQLSKDQRIIMPTTNSAYGSGDKGNFCDEQSPLNPLSLYARDKVEVEKQLMEHPNATSFRLATVFGISSRMRLDLLVNNFTYRALTDGFLVVFEGHFKRNYIHLQDVIRAFILAIDSPEDFRGEIFNVGLPSANISKRELCVKIKQFLPDFVFTEESFGKDPDQRNYIVSNKKIEGKGFKPQISLEMGIQELIKGLKMYARTPFTNLQ